MKKETLREEPRADQRRPLADQRRPLAGARGFFYGKSHFGPFIPSLSGRALPLGRARSSGRGRSSERGILAFSRKPISSPGV